MGNTEPASKSKRGGARPGAGRKKNGHNKPIKERQAVIAEAIDRMKGKGGQTGKEALERMLKLAEGCVALNRPTSKRETGSGQQENPDGDWDRFGQWFDRWAFVAGQLARYQSPTFRAVAVASQIPLPETAPPPSKTIEGSVVRLPDAEDAETAYLRMIGTAA